MPQGRMSSSSAESTCLATAIGKIPFGDGTVSKTSGTLKHRKTVVINLFYKIFLQNPFVSRRLLSSRRHHSLCVYEEFIYLIGGYGKHRIILDSVDRYDTFKCQFKLR